MILSHMSLFKRALLPAAIIAVNGSAFAQSSDLQELYEEPLIVTGIRASIAKSVDDKRESKNIVDTINAEDIGKTTDQNIADALSRITGVSVVTVNGEGSKISVRGSNSEQNNIMLNGSMLSSSEFNSAIDLSAYSAGIIQKIEVVKTPSADHDEGSLGANVYLTTVRPLELSEDKRGITVESRYNKFSKESDYRVSGVFTRTFMDDTLGFAVNVYRDTNTFRKDQYRVDDWVDSGLVRIASTQNPGETVSGVKAIQPGAVAYDLESDTNDRWGLNTTIQAVLGDNTDLTFDFNYANQSKENHRVSVSVRETGSTNLVEGEPLSESRRSELATFSDPQAAWWEINTDTHTFTKRLNRYGSGDISISDGGSTVDNYTYALSLDHIFSNSLEMKVSLNGSSSSLESIPGATLRLQNSQANDYVLADAGPEGSNSGIEPVGFDCTSGICVIKTGQSSVNLGANLNAVEDLNGNLQPGYLDNIALTGFNPRDLGSMSLSSISEGRQRVTDDILALSVDFDWELDFSGLSELEFGAKFSQREKYVDDQVFVYNSILRADTILDANDNVVAEPGAPVSRIHAIDIRSGNGLPYSNFMQTLGYEASNATNGLELVSPSKAIDLILGDEAKDFVSDPGQTRQSDLDIAAAYLKLNFAFFDDRLHGDIGARYVQSKLTATGADSIQFYSYSDFPLERDFDMVKMAELRDRSLPACLSYEELVRQVDPGRDFRGRLANESDAEFAARVQASGGPITTDEARFMRIDGFGYYTPPNVSPEDWNNAVSDQGDCHEPVLADWGDWYNASTEERQTMQNPALMVDEFGNPTHNVGHLQFYRHADISTTHNYAWGEYWGKATASGAVGWLNVQEQDRSRVAIARQDSHTYINLLPSLNANYLITDDLVARLALSRTMTRAPFEDTRAGYHFTEDMWGGNNTAETFNAQLKPLESDNIDVSLEYYFGTSNSVVFTVFKKDQSNFVDIESGRTYIQDLRPLVDSQELLDPQSLYLTSTGVEATNYGLEGCMPRRKIADSPFVGGASDSTEVQENWSDSYLDNCAQAEFRNRRNGKGASLEGFEIQYTQAFDFLPGVLGGTGINTNYTYTDSRFDEDISSITGAKSPVLPVAETPKHTYNATLYWEQEGHQLRLAYRGSSDSLVDRDYFKDRSGRNWNQGSLWNEGSDSLDFSANIALTEFATLGFQYINILDAETRQYYTSRTHEVVSTTASNDDSIFEALDEGNPLDGGVTKSRTTYRYKNGSTLRFNFQLSF